MLQCVDVVMRSGDRGKLKMATDFLQGGGIDMLIGVFLYVVEYFFLFFGKHIAFIF